MNINNIKTDLLYKIKSINNKNDALKVNSEFKKITKELYSDIKNVLMIKRKKN